MLGDQLAGRGEDPLAVALGVASQKGTVARGKDPSRYFEVRGRVVDVTTDGGAEHIEMLSQKYFGGPYPWYGGRDQVRVIITIEPEKVNSMG